MQYQLGKGILYFELSFMFFFFSASFSWSQFILFLYQLDIDNLWNNRVCLDVTKGKIKKDIFLISQLNRYFLSVTGKHWQLVSFFY